MGRHTTYTEAIGAEICKRICQRNETGYMNSLQDVCRAPDMPTEWCVYNWLGKFDDFAKAYARARETRADMMAEDILEISDTEKDAAKARNRIEARKWYAAKLNPKRYGEKVTNVHEDPEGKRIVPVLNVTIGRDQSQPA